MRIHVVQSGDTLWELGRKYGIPMQRIIDINQIQEETPLVIGQALVIPGADRIYIVQRGDTLWSISRKYNIPVSRIVEVNNITNPDLIREGQELRIPEKTNAYGFIETNAYIVPTTAERDTQLVDAVGAYLSFVSPFAYRANADGTVELIEDEAILRAARRNRIAPLLVLTNQQNGAYSRELASAIFADNEAQQALINNILGLLTTKGYTGLVVQFLGLTPADRDSYMNFLRKLEDVLIAQGFSVAAAIPSKTSAQPADAYDYPAIGEILDFVILLPEDWAGAGAVPSATAPADRIRSVLNYAVSVIPPEKILLGLPLYGYDWVGSEGRRISPVEALELARRYGARIQYDTVAQAPFFTYYDNQRRQRTVWFEDARSVEEKLKLASEFGLRGVSYNSLGIPFPQNWAVLDHMFQIEKLIR